MRSPVTLGLDFGTSGARVTAVDGGGAVLADAKAPWAADAARDWPAAWAAALWALLEGLPADVRAAAAAIAVDGTSASALLVDGETGAPLTAPLMYNDACPDALPGTIGALRRVVEARADVAHAQRCAPWRPKGTRCAPRRPRWPSC
jgi:sugar (pentulose or hexulose) kinase